MTLAPYSFLDAHAVAARYRLKSQTVRLWGRKRLHGFPAPQPMGRKLRWDTRDLELWEQLTKPRPEVSSLIRARVA